MKEELTVELTLEEGTLARLLYSLYPINPLGGSTIQRRAWTELRDRIANKLIRVSARDRFIDASQRGC